MDLRPEIMDQLQNATTQEVMAELKRRGFTEHMLIRSFALAKAPPPKPDSW